MGLLSSVKRRVVLFANYNFPLIVCIGLHLARIELRCAAARFFLTYPEAKVSTLEGFNDEDMVPRVYFFAEPKAKRCLIQRS